MLDDYIDSAPDGMVGTSARRIPAAAPSPPPHTTPFPEGKSVLGIIYGVLLWAECCDPAGGVGPLCNVPWSGLLPLSVKEQRYGRHEWSAAPVCEGVTVWYGMADTSGEGLR